MNYMEQVAHMLGVELGEEFLIKEIEESKYKLTMGGIFYYDDIAESWLEGSAHHDIAEAWLESSLLYDILKGKFTMIKKPILDEVEKEYLSSIIKPFRKRVEFIVKRSVQQYEYIEIAYRELNTIIGNAFFPLFAENTMYKNMKINKEYTLDELGL